MPFHNLVAPCLGHNVAVRQVVMRVTRPQSTNLLDFMIYKWVMTHDNIKKKNYTTICVFVSQKITFGK